MYSPAEAATQPVAAATGTHPPTPVEQHGALGGQSAAAAEDAASEGAGGNFVAAFPLGAFVFRNLARLSPMDRLRSEVVGRLLRTPCARVFPRLLARRRQVVVVRRAPAKQAGPLWLALRRPLCSVRAASQAT